MWVEGEVKGMRMRVRWEVEGRFCVNDQLWSVVECIQLLIKPSTNFTDTDAFEDMVTKFIDCNTAGTNWLGWSWVEREV